MKVGIVLVTHGPSAGAMLAEVSRMLGPGQIEGISALEIDAAETRPRVLDRIRAAAEAADRGAGVVIVCDLHGSTPTNCAVEFMNSHERVAVICGVNLPMVMKLCTTPREGVTPEQVAQAAVDTAVRSIRVEKGREKP